MYQQDTSQPVGVQGNVLGNDIQSVIDGLVHIIKGKIKKGDKPATFVSMTAKEDTGSGIILPFRRN